jgi:hypothetical protein
MWQQRQYSKEKEDALIKQGKGKLLARLMAQRNLDPLTIDKFTTAEYNQLSSPFTLNDVKKAANIFIEIVKEKGKISFFTDYDSDGIIAATMLKELCQVFSIECQPFLPSRL